MEWKDVISITAALFIFVLGQLSILIKEYLKKRKEERELREYFIEQVQLLEGPISRQISSLTELIKSLETKETLDRTLATIPMKHFYLLKSIDYSLLYTSFKKGKYADQNRAEYREIVSRLFNLEDYPVKINSQFQSFSEKYSSINDKYKSHFTEIKNIYYRINFNTDIVEGAMNKDFINEWKKLEEVTILMNVNKRGYYSIINQTEKYLYPLSKICFKHSGDVNADKVFEHINEIHMLYIDYKNLFESTTRVFKWYRKNGEVVYGQIKESISKLKF